MGLFIYVWLEFLKSPVQGQMTSQVRESYTATDTRERTDADFRIEGGRRKI